MAKKREIRVFISSTFLDMQEERDHLNRVVFPKLRKKCADRGVSFYAIDLRWGVTEEETRLNRTIDICLDHVKQCVPFFIGLIGNRYGWIPEQTPLVEKYPWIGDYGAISATEMEIRYYLREAKESKKRSFFALKGNALCLPDFDDHRHAELKRLTDAVGAETGRAPFVYESMEALGEAVYENILAILEEEYPAEECTAQFRISRYLKELDDYDDSDEFRRMARENRASGGNPFLFARRDPMAFEVMEQALLRFRQMILLETAGTEQLCNRYIYHTLRNNLYYSQPGLKSILLMLDADDRLRTPLAIMEELCAQLREHVRDADRHPAPKADVAGTERLRLLQSLAIEMLQDLKTEELMICVTNLHLLNSASPWYYLPFLVLFTQGNVRLMLTTADPEQAKLLGLIGVPVRNFPIKLASAERAGFLAALIRSMELEGKHLEKTLADRFLQSACLKDMESAVFVAAYLKHYVLFEDLSETVLKLLTLAEETDAHTAVWLLRQQALLSDARFNQQERLQILRIAGAIFRVLCHVRLEEATLYRVFTESDDTPKFLYLEACALIRPFLTFDGSGLCICSWACKQALAGVFDEASHATMGKGLVSAILSDLNKSWRSMDDSYALLRYLAAANDTEQIIRLVTDNSWLNIVRQTDPCLLRMGWRALKNKGLLDVEKIYTASNHINSHFNMTTSLLIYDLLMRMEINLAGTNSIECFLDPPFSYTTDVDKEVKGDWSREDHRAVEALRQTADTMEDAQLRQLPRQYAEDPDLKTAVATFLWEIVCETLAKRKSLTAEDVVYYLRAASELGSLHQIADAVLYFSGLDDAFQLLQ